MDLLFSLEEPDFIPIMGQDLPFLCNEVVSYHRVQYNQQINELGSVRTVAKPLIQNLDLPSLQSPRLSLLFRQLWKIWIPSLMKLSAPLPRHHLPPLHNTTMMPPFSKNLIQLLTIFSQLFNRSIKVSPYWLDVTTTSSKISHNSRHSTKSSIVMCNDIYVQMLSSHKKKSSAKLSPLKR